MPHVGVHISLARHVLRDWAERPASAAVDVRAEGVTNAFLAGAIAPDAGFSPGADRLISDLAHMVRTVRWPAALLAGARTEAEKAFAWGWLAHVLTDAALHPEVNRAVAEMLGRTGIRADRAQRWGHARAELALDVRAHARDPDLARVRLRPVFRRADAPRLQAAFEAVYGPGVSGQAFVRAHRISTLTQSLQLVAGRVHARADRASGRADRVAAAGLRLLAVAGRHVLPEKHVLRAYIDRDQPPEWLARRTDAFADELVDDLARAARSGMAALPDLDLGTGQIIEEARPRPRARATLDHLAARNGGRSLPGRRAA